MKTMDYKPDILIITVTDIEQRAVIDTFQNMSGNNIAQRITEQAIYIDLGILAGASVWMTVSGMGSIGPRGSTLAINNVIKDVSPGLIIMVGIAFGVDPEKQEIGQVLISNKVITYEQERVGATQVTSRHNHIPASSRLVGIFNAARHDWVEARTEIGAILSGEKLVDNKAFRDRLIAMEPDAIGGEMEGAGLCSAAHEAKIDWILVKAICDWADGTKDRDTKNRQAVAARNAAIFTYHVLQRGVLPWLQQPLASSRESGRPAESIATWDKELLGKIADEMQGYMVSSQYGKAVKRGREVFESVGDFLNGIDAETDLLVAKIKVLYAQALLYAEGIDKARPLLKDMISQLETRKLFFLEQGEFIRAEYNLVAGQARNILGYAYWMDRGSYELALKELTQALKYFKDGKWEHETATAYDNLGRIYAQLGYRTHAELLIDGGLKLRTSLGNDYRLALSLNSSALVHLIFGQYYRAFMEIEQAEAIFRLCISQNGERGLGLALITKSRALRSLGSHWRFSKDSASSELQLLNADAALEEAAAIFTRVDEDLRLLQVYNESGCVHRELCALYMHAGDQEKARQELNKAEKCFKKIITRESEKKYPVVYVDTYHDLAQTYYICKKLTLARNWVETADKLIPDSYKLSNSLNPLSQRQFSEDFIEDYWQELGKIYELKGDLAFRKISLSDEYRSEGLTNDEDEAIKKKLRDAFEAYFQAACYFGRFLDRPLAKKNGCYPKDTQSLESSLRFTQKIFDRLKSLNTNDISFIRAEIENSLMQAYKPNAKWINRFFQQPFKLLL